MTEGLEAARVVLRCGGLVSGGGESRVCIRRGLVGGGAQDDAVHDRFNGMVLALLEAHALGDLGHLAIDPYTEALLIECRQLFAELALAATHDRRHDGDALGLRTFGQTAHRLVDDARHNLLRGLARDGSPAIGAVRLAHGRPQQAEIVVNLGDRSDGRSWRSRGSLLLD